MELYMKIGTLSGQRVRVKYKRNYPKVGDWLLVRDVCAGRYTKWDQVRVYKIDGEGHNAQYFAERI